MLINFTSILDSWPKWFAARKFCQKFAMLSSSEIVVSNVCPVLTFTALAYFYNMRLAKCLPAIIFGYKVVHVAYFVVCGFYHNIIITLLHLEYFWVSGFHIHKIGGKGEMEAILPLDLVLHTLELFRLFGMLIITSSE